MQEVFTAPPSMAETPLATMDVEQYSSCRHRQFREAHGQKPYYIPSPAVPMMAWVPLRNSFLTKLGIFTVRRMKADYKTTALFFSLVHPQRRVGRGRNPSSTAFINLVWPFLWPVSLGAPMVRYLAQPMAAKHLVGSFL